MRSPSCSSARCQMSIGIIIFQDGCAPGKLSRFIRPRIRCGRLSCETKLTSDGRASSPEHSLASSILNRYIELHTALHLLCKPERDSPAAQPSCSIVSLETE